MCYGPHIWTSRLVVARDPSGIVCYTEGVRPNQTIEQRVSKSHAGHVTNSEHKNVGMLGMCDILNILTYQCTELFHRSQVMYLKTLCPYIR